MALILRNGGSQSPDRWLKEPRNNHGKYGMLRKQFLKEHRSAKYQYLLLTGKLTEHLNQIDQEARKQVEILMEQMVKKQGATEELKAQDQMKWVRLMINIKSSAEEIVVKNTIYM
ncbi:TnpV protein [Blautia wexlerae]|uniref:TnpV protein n=1 Tax=Blautia wexlerae TaxID=418240 RepID=UPI0034A42296